MQGQRKWGLAVLLGMVLGRIPGVMAEPPARNLGAALVDAQEIIEKVLTREEGEIVERGSIVVLVERDGPLYRAGLRTADAIVELGGAQVNGTGDVLHILGQRPIGSRVKLTFVRDGAVLATELDVEGPRYGPIYLGTLTGSRTPRDELRAAKPRYAHAIRPYLSLAPTGALPR